MFTRIFFYYDENGELFLKPRELRAKDAKAKMFTAAHGESKGMPSLVVLRESLLNVKTDPYNEDGRPPLVLFRIYYPTVELCGRYIQVVGFEDPNLALAGKLVEPYKLTNRPWDKVVDKRKENVDDIWRPVFFPQKIILWP